MKSLTGAGILVLGLFLLFVNLDGLAAQVSDVIGAPAGNSIILPAIGLAGWHAVQAYTFDHAGFSSSVLHLLVSFWPLIPVTAGAMLLKSAAQGRPVKSAMVATSGKRA
ncbi:MAG TPA: hypothetical protein VMR90_05310 [Candidatus Cybelea sp.]|nr:hypothetical protein [Candidatus Cybelea sp.]